MMAVTDEEMALLEMMRNKRAAMQQNSFSEGYRQALRREHEQLMQRRLLAQQTALRILRSKEQQESVTLHQVKDERDEHEVDEKEIRRLNKLRQQEIDRTARLEKFLAMDTSLAAALSDAGIDQDDLIQDWPLTKKDALPPEGARRNRRSIRTPSFSHRDVYEDKPRHEHRARADTDELALTFPSPPNMDPASHHRNHYSRESASFVKSEEAKTVETKRKTQALYTKQTIEDAAYRQELYMLKSKSAQTTRQQIQAATFLRSLSDYHGAESVTSQGSASVSASIVSPMTPSSTGAGHTAKLTAYGNVEDNGYMLDKAAKHYERSPELTFSRKKKQGPSALAILAESDRSSYRNSMTSNNSAGEDVLAAWAELGGGMLPSRGTRG